MGSAWAASASMTRMLATPAETARETSFAMPGCHTSMARKSRSGQRCAAATTCSPTPGPISTTVWPGSGLMASTIASMTARSVRKFWPKRLRGMCFMQ